MSKYFSFKYLHFVFQSLTYYESVSKSIKYISQVTKTLILSFSISCLSPLNRWFSGYWLKVCSISQQKPPLQRGSSRHWGGLGRRGRLEDRASPPDWMEQEDRRKGQLQNILQPLFCLHMVGKKEQEINILYFQPPPQRVTGMLVPSFTCCWLLPTMSCTSMC